jgi:hypothetical protein
MSSTCEHCGFIGATGRCCAGGQTPSVQNGQQSTAPSGSYSTRIRATRLGNPPQAPTDTTTPSPPPSPCKRRSTKAKASARASAKARPNQTAIFGVGPSMTAVPSTITPSLILSHTNQLSISSNPIMSPVIPTTIPLSQPLAQSTTPSLVSSTAINLTPVTSTSGITHLPIVPHSTSTIAGPSVGPPPSYDSIVQSREPSNARPDLWYNGRGLAAEQVEPYKRNSVIPKDSIRIKTRPNTPFIGCVLCEYVNVSFDRFDL